MREENASDFFVDVSYSTGEKETKQEHVLGRFRFARRTIRDTFRIRSYYSRLTDGHYDEKGDAADLVAWSFAQVQVLLVGPPAGFNLEELDPLVDESWEIKALSIFKALRDKELSFRPPTPDAVQNESAKPEVNVSAGVSPPV